MDTFAELQVGLSQEGFFLRGGIAFGQHYMDEDIVFGDALLDAVALDQGGGPPRLSLAPSAVTMVRRQLGFYAEPEWATQSQDLLQDTDGTIFLNYLNQAFFAYPDGGVFFEVIEGHKRSVIKGLEDYKGEPGVTLPIRSRQLDTIITYAEHLLRNIQSLIPHMLMRFLP